jgi:thiol-disulfide isomerase/thioredoxin
MRAAAPFSYLAWGAVAVGVAGAGLAYVGSPSAPRAQVEPAPQALAPTVAPCEGAHDKGEACKAPVATGEKGDVLASGVPELLEFEAAYCSACATMAPVVKAVVSSCAKAAASVKHVDVESDKGEAIARRYEVASLPTFIAVDADGHEVFRRVGVQPPKEIASILAEVTGESCVVD